MKIVDLSCPNCHGELHIDLEKQHGINYTTCEYCHCMFAIDDEIKRVEHKLNAENAEEFGYKIKKGMLKAENENRYNNYQNLQQIEQMRQQNQIEAMQIQNQRIDDAKESDRRIRLYIALAITVVICILIPYLIPFAVITFVAISRNTPLKIKAIIIALTVVISAILLINMKLI